MIEIFATDDYRKQICMLIKRDQQLGRRTNLTNLADASKVQRPYISKVLRGNADLNSDQLYLICSFFKLSAEVTEYMLLCLDLHRSQIVSRKKTLRQRIQNIQNSQLRPNKQTSAKILPALSSVTDRYYLDPMIQLVHIFLGTSTYGHDLTKISHRLGISSERTADIIQFLLEAGLVSLNGKKYELNHRHLHLAGNSPVCIPHQLLVRVKSLERLQRLEDQESFRYSLTFSGTGKLANELKQHFLEYIKAMEPVLILHLKKRLCS